MQIRTSFRTALKRYNAFLAASEPAYAYDGNLEAFCGQPGTITRLDASASALFQRPDIVVKGKTVQIPKRTLLFWAVCCSIKLCYSQGEEKELQFVFGISESLEEARAVSEKFSNSAAVEKELEKAETHYLEKYRSLTVETPDEKINHMMNNWVKNRWIFALSGKKESAIIFRLRLAC